MAIRPSSSFVWPPHKLCGTEKEKMEALELLRQDRKPFALCGFAQAVIQTDEFMPGGLSIRPHDGCRQLHRIGGSKRMQEQNPPCLFSNHDARLDFCPDSH